MEITEVRVKKLNTTNRLKGIASVTLDDCFVVRGIKIIDSAKGLFIAMPSERVNENRFQDLVHPINANFRQRLQDVILKEFDKVEE